MSDIFMLARIIVIAVAVIGVICAIVSKFAMKKELESGLGRKVKDRDLTDIGAWMKVPPDEGQIQPASGTETHKADAAKGS